MGVNLVVGVDATLMWMSLSVLVAFDCIVDRWVDAAAWLLSVEEDGAVLGSA